MHRSRSHSILTLVSIYPGTLPFRGPNLWLLIWKYTQSTDFQELSYWYSHSCMFITSQTQDNRDKSWIIRPPILALPSYESKLMTTSLQTEKLHWHVALYLKWYSSDSWPGGDSNAFTVYHQFSIYLNHVDLLWTECTYENNLRI